MKIVLKPKKSSNYIATICIGKKYENDWKKFTLPSWIEYCKKNDIGIVYFNKELISKNDPYWKKPVWHQLLIGTEIKKKNIKNIKNICYVDTDVFINPWSPNIFRDYKNNKIAAVSSIKNLPFNLDEVRKKVVFFRKKFIDDRYPLDSSILCDLKQVYSYCNLKPQKDLISTGIYVYNLRNHSELLKKWFYLYDKNIKSVTSGGIQTHFSYHLMESGKVQWLNYRFQAHWIYEMSHHYPFLYKTRENKLVIECLLASLMNNYFLHCAGSWNEGRMWKNILFQKKNIIFFENLDKYLRKKVTGKFRGYISQN
jgi:hypothetical protein